MRWFTCLLLMCILAACTPLNQPSPDEAWDYTDLRLIDAADSLLPEEDLVAAYLRADDQELQIRLDLLEMAGQPGYDLYLAIDSRPGGSNSLPIAAQPAFGWEILLAIPAEGAIQAYRYDPNSGHNPLLSDLGLRVMRDPNLDSVTVHFNRTLPETGRLSNPGVQVFLTHPASSQVVDKITPVHLNGSPPPPAQALLVFWNVLPAYTPAQALRRWDGAHAGPLGGRHGLYNLLKSATKTGTPLALLDLKTPGSLAALDFMGGLGMVQEMAAQDLLILPEVSPGFLGDPGSEGGLTKSSQLQAAEAQAHIVRNFDLSPSRVVFLPAEQSEQALDAAQTAFPGTRLIFTWQEKSGQVSSGISELSAMVPLLKRGRSTLILIPSSEMLASDARKAPGDGLSLAARSALANAAALQPSSTASPAQILLLGGSLPDSAWGNPQFSQETLHYLAGHPWIKVLGAKDLLAIKPSLAFESDAGNQSPLLLSTDATQDLFNERLSLPDNLASQAAWQTYLALGAPVPPGSVKLGSLRAHYAGQLGALAEAARWAEQPASHADCNIDYDQDGQPECILSSQRIFMLFELEEGGFLAYGFVITGDGKLHQFAAPSSQLITGTSSDSTWDLQRGLLADPAVLPGAFFEIASPTSPLPVARASIGLNSLTLTYSASGSDRQIHKTFTLMPGGLSVDYTATPPAPLTTLVNLTFDPWLRFYPGWQHSYQFDSPTPGRMLATTPGLQAAIKTDANLTLDTFLDTYQAQSRPEDPNQEHPPGHYLPFPIASAKLSSNGNFSLQIIFSALTQ